MATRRKFLADGTKLMAGGLALSSFTESPFSIRSGGRFSPADRLNVGAIGINGMGFADLQSALKQQGVNVVALCDIDQNVIDKRKKDLSAKNVDVSKITTYGDYRKLLANKDVDIVIVGTPDHWHCLQMVEACQAGKDVYVEKPIGNSIEECNIMVNAQKKYNRAVQVGQWQRSQQHFRDAVDFIKTGQLGNIRMAKVWCYQGWMRPGPVIPDTAPPPGVDYTFWLGPAPTRTFNASRFHFNFRWFWDYAGGLMTDWGVHLLDYALYGMQADMPKSVAALGGRFAYPDLLEETPDTLTTLYEFDKFNIIWDSALGIDNGQYGLDHGIAYVGNNGTLVLSRHGWEVIEEKQSQNKVSKPKVNPSDNGLDKHWENFTSVVRSRKFEELHAPPAVGAQVATVAQMGNVAFRTGEKVFWDKAAGKFTSDKANKDYFVKAYNNGWKLPTV